MTNRKHILIFVALTFAITWGMLLIMTLCGIQYGSSESVLVLAGCMIVPAVCSILTRLITKEGFSQMLLRPKFKGHMRYYAMGAYLPFLLILLGAAVYFLIFPSSFDITASAMSSSLLASGVPAQQLQLVIILQIVQGVVLGPFINLIFTMGEELGWRGYLLPRLVHDVGAGKAMLISGLIWGAWHAPMIALGHNYGIDYPLAPWLGIVMMILFCVSLGCILSFVTLKAKSAWPAAMGHSMINAIAALPVYFCIAPNVLVGPSSTGIIGMSAIIGAAVICFIKGRKLTFAETIKQGN